MKDEKIAKEIAFLKKENLYRKIKTVSSIKRNKILVDGKWHINFGSNDYLGLSHHKSIQQAIISAIRRTGVGAGASHLISGHHSSHESLEIKAAKYLGFDQSLYFSSGYLANLTFFGSLLKKEDAIFSDKLNHASLNDGAILSCAKFYRFKHLDLIHLEDLLKKSNEKNKIIVTDGVFSMDGDIADIRSLLSLCHQYDAHLFVDDAHGYGVLGSDGQGILEHTAMNKLLSKKDRDRIIYMFTLGKSVGVSGAILCAKKNIIDFLIQKGKPYIYTTATMPAIAEGISLSLDLIKDGKILREKLIKNIQIFRESICKKNLLMNSITAIQPILIGSPEQTLYTSACLLDQGFYVPAIRPPTVPKNQSRLRVSLSANHSKNDVLGLTKAINRLTR